jgi:hypothetical protein
MEGILEKNEPGLINKEAQAILPLGAKRLEGEMP